jgi:hypothetical protein
MYLCMVIDVIQNNTPERTIVMIPGTHPKTLEGKTRQSREQRYSTTRCRDELTRATMSAP